MDETRYGRNVYGDHNEPTWEDQIWQARKLLADKGYDALNNPHAMIGRMCGCGDCFCCAALLVIRETAGSETAGKE